ncbi:hypothetical protein D5086_003753 [Populus alba]|uniref:Uncharacterized protein n=1 Tax=Populus alba TaxID=43335 RepID=A0ACC4D5R2_POPAL
MATPTSISFAVRRREPELVAPAKATPHEFRQLSDIDRQLYLQFQSPHYNLIRSQGPDNKLIVDCTGEGVLFIEADADATVEQFGDPIPSPFPCFQELLYNVPGSDGILNTPLLLFQVDYGWGNTIYTGPPKAMPDEISIAGTYFLPYRFKNGERGVMLLVSLRAPVMERFAILLEELARHDPERSQEQQEMIPSSL